MIPPGGPSRRATDPKPHASNRRAGPSRHRHARSYQDTSFLAPELPTFLSASPEQYYKPNPDEHAQYASIPDLSALSDPLVVPFGPAMQQYSGNGMNVPVHDEWTWAVNDISAASHLPSLDTGSTISNVSTRSCDTIIAKGGNHVSQTSMMMPPAWPLPNTRASSLDFNGLHPPPCILNHRLESPAVLSEISDASTIRSPCPSPDKQGPITVATRASSGSSSIDAGGKHRCSWAGCVQLNFTSHEGLVWHVKADHLLVCPAPGCVETTFASARHVYTHLAVAHPELGLGEVKEWVLDNKQTPVVVIDDDVQPAARKEPEKPSPRQHEARLPKPAKTTQQEREASKPVEDPMTKELLSIATSKRKCQEQLRNAVEKKAKRRVANAATEFPHSPLTSFGSFTSAPSPTDLVRSRAANLIETASFPLIYEHMILPFLAEFLPRWTSPKHVISVIRGKTRDSRRICILTETDVSFTRKIIIARHVRDLLPDNHKQTVSFVFSKGEVVRTQQTWARGLNRDQIDDICTTRNPYYYRSPCMGDSIGIPQQGNVDEATATLGPCLTIDGAGYWLSNFHPFLDAYQSLETIRVEHPSPQDRAPCLEVAHDALCPDGNYSLGDVAVTSGLNLSTTRISHEPYWEDCAKDQPLVVTDWALLTATASLPRANMLRRFPSEMQPTRREPLIRNASCVTPGAPVCSSGRTSGFQRGQVCEIPAFVSGVANGTGKATREWFVEEPYNCDDEDAWIRGGIGVSGDSGAAVVDADTSCIIGQVWGRNKYWGPGPRQAFFTPISDVFDDIQEKCGQQDRPQLPQFRDEADTYAVLPTCQRCYDLQTYYDSRRSSRVSLQSMIMDSGGGDQDALTSTEAASELATPRDRGGLGLEETGSAFNNIFSPSQMGGAQTPGPSDMKSPYASMIVIDEEPPVGGARKRGAQLPLYTSGEAKRPRVDGERARHGFS